MDDIYRKRPAFVRNLKNSIFNIPVDLFRSAGENMVLRLEHIVEREVEVIDFEGLKELMLAEQIKRRAPLQIRHHYLDDWEEFKTASILAGKCDRYEALTGY